MSHEAVLLAGSLGLGHEMMARCCTSLLEQSGWQARCLDSMALLGSVGGRAGERLFHRLVEVPGLYDGLHFAHLRTGSRLAQLLDRMATAKLVPALRADLERQPAELAFSVFATGASAAAQIKREQPGLRTVVLCTDVSVHRIWAAEGTDLFLVTSPAAEESVRRYLPRANVAIVPPPVRTAFYAAPSQAEARSRLGVPAQSYCVLMIDSGWGFGPLLDIACMLADAGVEVLAVAGRHRATERKLRELALVKPRIRPFGFTNRVPELMAASDLVLALPGATTCSEARVVGRQLILLDVMPGHGRDNLQHELEQGGAHVSTPTAAGVAARALALRDQTSNAPAPAPVPRWEPAYAAALRRIGIDVSAPVPVQAPRATVVTDGRATAQAGSTTVASHIGRGDNPT